MIGDPQKHVSDTALLATSAARAMNIDPVSSSWLRQAVLLMKLSHRFVCQGYVQLFKFPDIPLTCYSGTIR
jgi:transglutaminase/protease-like cytokinesis protein 3